MTTRQLNPKLQSRLGITQEQLAEFCQRWKVVELALFGSVLRDDFRPDSDIDIMVEFHPEARPTFSTLDRMEAELKIMFDREIDLITRQGIASSRNYLRRHEILSSAQVIYATGSAISA
ncbi:nucleotidyltransferase family protein [Limnothrix redekei]|uniref:Nucleotidyltransferase domain-containing protein n=1 Tax=Limnothrix redekei LRLZ20PSL1 TaxID=3112953 RepID=A0ABW7CDB3_9CYAN